ncbi:MAG: type I DNA topoisomerase [Rhodanobacteraceae bacterium]|nr:MAG: type I DNA topoisomerase [Rhodanobacteraceae bacterium]
MTTLVIVESPGKLKKIRAILGDGYRVEASVGHVRDLPRKEMGVAPPDYRPHYEKTERGADVLQKLKASVSACERVVLATDPDREGEAIAWHLADALNLKNYQRVTFNAIEAGPVRDGLQHPRQIDMALVHAQEARRVLDRLVGYTVSPLLSRSAGQPLSAGRVQSPAVRLIVERERAIAAFKSTQHYTAMLTFGTGEKAWTATWDTKPYIKEGERYFTDLAMATEVAALRDVTVTNFEDGQSRSAPHSPFTTSSLQKAAQAALTFKPKQTMDLAQKLYEQGAITYHRTDNPNLGEDGHAMLAAWAKTAGIPLVDPQRRWKAKDSAQEAHEAIRPTHFDAEKAGETDEERRLYNLIRTRAIASQMPDAVYAVRTVTMNATQPVGGQVPRFIARGRKLIEPGWRSMYLDIQDKSAEEKIDDEAESGADNPVPVLKVGARGKAVDGDVVSKTTKPPPRFRQASLVEEMERLGIGRPSTYAAILTNILGRDYIVEDKKGFLKPCPTGAAIVDALVGKCRFIDLDYTRVLEDQLDAVAHGKAEYVPTIRDAHQHLQGEIGNIGGVHIEGVEQYPCPHCGSAMRRIKGKTGYFWGCSNYPECKMTLPDVDGKPGSKPVTKAKPSEFACPDCGRALVKRSGRNGAFWGCSGYPECSTTLPDADGKPGTRSGRGHSHANHGASGVAAPA